MTQSLTFQAHRDETTLPLHVVAARLKVSRATLSRRCSDDARWRAASIYGATGLRVRGISIPAAVESGIAVYATTPPAELARSVISAVQADPVLRRELAAALLGVA
jgi:hypothetical protein